jgi:serine/threonine protein kinase, bacterial
MTHSKEALLTPTLLNNRYQVLGVLGDGGFGKTFLAEDTQMPSARKCVVKQLKPVEDDSQIFQMVQDRFQREAAILEKLGENHDQIPRLYGYFSEGDLFYLVEEWIQGDTLTQKVQREGVLSEAIVKDILIKLLPAIAHVHQQQIVHRDLKPDNIILRQSDGKPVLIDFGAVKETMTTILNDQGKSTQSIVMGTPGFMSSEQMAGRPVFASDIYSLGMTAIYMLTGKLPSEFASDIQTGEILWQQHAPIVSPAFAAIINRAIHMHSNFRFPSADNMLSVLTVGENIAPMGMPSKGSSHPATVVSAAQPATHSGHVTQIMLPSQIPSAAGMPMTMTAGMPAANSSGGELKKALITGGIIGFCILAGAVVIKGEIPGVTASKKAEKKAAAATKPKTATVTNAVSKAPPAAASMAMAPAQPAAPSMSSTGSGNATVVGEPGIKNIRSGPTTGHAVLATTYPGNRVQVVGMERNSDGHPWYQVMLPNGGQGWMAGQLVEPDIQQSTPVAAAPAPSSSGTNATIVGEPGYKNIRSGPGTSFRAAHIAYPGDRVRVLESTSGSGGYTWYKVYFPNSGADGWIAGQLISRD